jgi:hypothetical protein
MSDGRESFELATAAPDRGRLWSGKGELKLDGSGIVIINPLNFTTIVLFGREGARGLQTLSRTGVAIHSECARARYNQLANKGRIKRII